MGWALEGWVQRAVKVGVAGSYVATTSSGGHQGHLGLVCPLVSPVQLLEAAAADSFLQDTGPWWPHARLA